MAFVYHIDNFMVILLSAIYDATFQEVIKRTLYYTHGGFIPLDESPPFAISPVVNYLFWSLPLAVISNTTCTPFIYLKANQFGYPFS